MGPRYLLDNLKWQVDKDAAIKKLRVMEDDLEDFDEIYARTIELIKPVYYMGREHVERIDGDDVVIGGTCFHSHVISVNLKDADAVYPYVGTSGRAAYEYAISLDDDLYKFWADQICELALRSAAVGFIQTAKQISGTEKLASLNPGSVVDWHISQQRPLFDLIGSVFEKTGIFLEESFLMRPVKSSSGILYPTDREFVSCSLCTKQNCPNRRAPFDREKFEKEYFPGSAG